MGWVFGKTTVWFRLGQWLKDLWNLVTALPSYINPKPLRPTPLTETERVEAELLLAAEEEEWVLTFTREPQGGNDPLKTKMIVYVETVHHANWDINKAMIFPSEAAAKQFSEEFRLKHFEPKKL